MAYNVPSTTLAGAMRLAATYMRSGIVPFLVSAPGVGKTTIARAIAKGLGAKFRALRLNNQAPEEIAGLQYVDREGMRSIHLPPKWMPAEDGSDGPVVIFIDEITQASDENRKAIMSALLERYLGDTQIPDNCYFIVAGNSADDGTNVYEFDRATADRFAVIRIRTDVEAWCNDYAPTVSKDMSVVSFLRVRPDCFEMSAELMKGDNVIGPSPRTWEAVLKFLEQAQIDGLDEDEIKLGIMGKIGEQVGAAFSVVRAQVMELKSVKDLLRMKPEDRRKHTPKTLDALWTYCQGMIWHATSIDRMHEVFELLDSFEEIDDVPFYETRFNVAETMYRRIKDVHNVDGAVNDPGLGARIVKWKQQLASNIALADLGSGEEGSQVAMRTAA